MLDCGHHFQLDLVPHLVEATNGPHDPGRFPGPCTRCRRHVLTQSPSLLGPIQWHASRRRALAKPISQMRPDGVSTTRMCKRVPNPGPLQEDKKLAPTWIPIVEKNAINIMSAHLKFLGRLRSYSQYMFLARDDPDTQLVLHVNE